MDLRSLIEQYTAYWNAADIVGFRSMIVDGCIRHDPGSTVEVSLEENERRLLDTHAKYPGLVLRNTWMWEHGAGAITVAYSLTVGDTVIASLEVFRFESGRIVEVWNVPPSDGEWLP